MSMAQDGNEKDVCILKENGNLIFFNGSWFESIVRAESMVKAEGKLQNDSFSITENFIITNT